LGLPGSLVDVADQRPGVVSEIARKAARPNKKKPSRTQFKAVNVKNC